METWTKNCGPIPGGSILTHTQIKSASKTRGMLWPRFSSGAYSRRIYHSHRAKAQCALVPLTSGAAPKPKLISRRVVMGTMDIVAWPAWVSTQLSRNPTNHSFVLAFSPSQMASFRDGHREKGRKSGGEVGYLWLQAL